MNVSMLPARMTAETPSLISPMQLVRALRRKAWLIVFCGLLGAIASFFAARTIAPYYIASALISVDSSRFLIPELQGAVGNPGSDPMPQVQTESRAISSRAMVQKIIDQMGLANNPEFNPSLNPPTFFAKLSAEVNTFVHQFLPPGPTVLTAPGATATDASVFGTVSNALKTTQDSHSTVIGLDFRSEDPQLAADFLNGLIHEYVGTLDAARRTADQAANSVLTEQLKTVSSEIEALQDKMRALRTKNDFVGLRSAGSVGQQQLEDLANAATQASVARAQIEATWQQANQAAKQGNPETLASVLGSPTIERLRQQESTALQRVADITQQHGPSYPDVQAAKADVAVAREQLAEEVKRIISSLASQVAVARTHEDETKQQLKAAQHGGLGSADLQVQLDQLQQEVDARHKLYQSILEGLQQSANSPSASNAVPQVRVLSSAVPPGLPAGPNKRMAAVLGVVGGGMLGALLAVGWSRGLPAFGSALEAMELTGLPVLASLPRRRRRGGLTARVLTEPGGHEAEELRVLRTRLRSLESGGSPRSVVFASAGRGDDASEVAAAFARVAAADGERVLLIEGNLQRPVLSDVFGATSSGLVQVLQSKGHWREEATRDVKTPLRLLLAGRQGIALHNGISSTIFQNLLVEAAEDYTLIVMDAQAVTTGSTAVTLVGYADAAVLVIDAEAVRYQIANVAVSRLADARAPALAIVLLGVA